MKLRLIVGAALSAALVIAPAATATAGGWKDATAVDGDTIKVAGKSIRVIGVDTPERGEKCYAAATKKTAKLIKRGVKLKKHRGTGNTDKYGRLLRYVKVRKGGKDLGAVLIKKGLAHARYDGKDGYSWHPKQRKYHRLDRKTKNGCKNSGGGPGGGTTGGNCDPNYRGGCVPRVSYDLDCSDISFVVRVVGTDRHRFDGDGDGIGCESNG